jgi:hypothetical protein
MACDKMQNNLIPTSKNATFEVKLSLFSVERNTHKLRIQKIQTFHSFLYKPPEN